MSVYGLRPYKMAGAYELITKVVKANTTITKFDPIHLEVDTADLAAAGEPIFGVAMDTVVQASGSLTVPILRGRDIVWQADNDNDTNTWPLTTYSPGSFFDITGATGAVLVDTSTATSSGQLVGVAAVSPLDPADASLGLFKINPAVAQS